MHEMCTAKDDVNRDGEVVEKKEQILFVRFLFLSLHAISCIRGVILL